MSTICRHIAAVLSALLVLGSALEAQISAISPGEAVQELHLRVVEGAGAEYKTGSLSDKSVVVAVTDQAGSPAPGAAVLFRLPGEGATGAFTDGTRATIVYSDMQGLATVRNVQWGSTPGPIVLRITATKGSAHAGILVPAMLTASGGHSKHVKSSVEAPISVAKPAQLRAVAAPPAPLQPGAEPAEASAPRLAELPSVSVVTDPKESAHSGSKKWIWIALIGAGAAAGGFAASGLSRSSSGAGAGSSAPVTIGGPSVSIGRP
jgi:hypothetical protein